MHAWITNQEKSSTTSRDRIDPYLHRQTEREKQTDEQNQS
jgi:hypothetical protein